MNDDIGGGTTRVVGEDRILEPVAIDIGTCLVEFDAEEWSVSSRQRATWPRGCIFRSPWNTKSLVFPTPR